MVANPSGIDLVEAKPMSIACSFRGDRRLCGQPHPLSSISMPAPIAWSWVLSLR